MRTLAAHEPSLASALPDHEHTLAATHAIHETYQRSDWGAGMAHFIAVTSHQGPFTAQIADQSAPDPAILAASPTPPTAPGRMATSWALWEAAPDIRRTR